MSQGDPPRFSTVLHGSPRFSNFDKMAPKFPIPPFSNIWGQLQFLDKKTSKVNKYTNFAKNNKNVQNNKKNDFLEI